MNKVVYNACFGGFSISPEAIQWLENKGIKTNYVATNIDRHDPLLVQCIEELGENANGEFSELDIELIDSDRYAILENGGKEQIITPTRVKWINIKF